MSPFVEQPVTLRSVGLSPVVADLDFSVAGSLLGYVQSDTKPTAEVLVASQFGHPLLVQWQYGRGRVSVWTSHLIGDWDEHLAAWDGFGVMMANLCRNLADTDQSQSLDVVARTMPAGVRIFADSRVGAAASGCAPLTLTVTDPLGRTHEHTAEPSAPAQWRMFLPTDAAGVYQLQARTQDGQWAGTAAWALSDRPENASLHTDTKLIDRINALRRDAAADAAVAATPTFGELWPTLSAWALVMFLLSILLRRLPWPPRTAATVLVGVLLLGTAGELSAATSPDYLTAPEVEQLTQLIQAGPDVTAADLDALCTEVQQRAGNLEPLLTYLQQRGARQGDGRYVLADVALRNADFGLALDALTGLTADTPQAWPAWARLAQVQEMSGREQEALTATERALSTGANGPSRVALQVRLAVLCYDLGQSETARAVLRSLAPDSSSELASFCAHLAGLYDDSATAASLLNTQTVGKTAYHRHLFKGLFLLRRSRPVEAQVAFEAAYALAPLQRDRRFALERLVTAAREAGDLDHLVQQWSNQDDLTADGLLALVTILREQNRSADALALLTDPARRRWSELVAADSELQQQLVAVAVESGQTEAAVAAYERLIALGGDVVVYRTALARLHLLAGQRDAAIDAILSAAEQNAKPAALLDLAEVARNLALDDLAIALADRAGGTGPAYALRAVIFKAELKRERGQIDDALALLRETKLPGDDAKLLMLLAETLERFGAEMDALALYRRIYDMTGAEDTLLRVAWLLEKNKQTEQAYELWVDLWRSTNNPARQRQAKERLLSLASQSGSLADLAIDLEERLDDGRGGRRELELLVDIYTAAQDPISAAEILYEFGRLEGNQAELLQRLVHVYLSCDMFGRCNTLLRRLVEVDPEHAADHYQQIAIIALERLRPREATAALAQLEALGGDDNVVEEFSAGVLNMIGLPDEAAQAYGRLLAANPDRIEAHLLWGNAMQAAGHGDQAVSRFLYLVETAAADDLFTVAVDGLINLNAPAPALRTALRRVYARIAAQPDKVFLYRLAVDLLDTLGDVPGQMAVLEQAVVVAGQRRGPILRELMTMAQQAGDVDRMIAFGRSLIGLGEDMPPQVFLDLGEALVYRGDMAAAERAFQRAAVNADYDAIQRQVAVYYEEAGMPQAALRIIGDLLITHPDDVGLLLQAGASCEQQGKFAAAQARYLAAIDLMVDRLASTDLDGDNGNAAADATGRRRISRSDNVDELTQYFETAVNGLIATTRAADTQAETIERTLRRAREELARLVASGERAAAVASNRRLHYLCGYLRRLAFAWHAIDAADTFDREVMAAYPEDDEFAQAAVASRLNWGLGERARALAAERPTLPEPLPLQAARMAALGGGNVESAQLAAQVAPLLIVHERPAGARAILKQAEDIEVSADVCRTFMQVAVALDDHDLLLRWANRRLDMLRQAGVAAATAAVRDDVRAIWPQLTGDERLAFYTRLDRLAASFEPDEAVELNLICWQLADALGTPFARSTAVSEAAARDPKTSTKALTQMLAQAAPSSRPALVRLMVESRNADKQRDFLHDLVGSMDFPVDEAFTDAVVTLYQAAPREKARANSVYSSLRRHGWNRNPRQVPLARHIAEVLVAEAPDDPAILAAAAVARYHAGAIDQAVILAREVIDLLAGGKNPTFQTRAMLLDLTDCLPSDELENILLDLEDRAAIEGETPLLLYARALLLERLERDDQARDLLCQAMQAMPGNRVISRKCMDMLEEADQDARLVELLGAVLTRTTMMESYEWRTLAQLQFGLGNAAAGSVAAAKDHSPLGPVEVLRGYRETGRYDQLTTALRRYITTVRRENRYSALFVSPIGGAGGLWGYLSDAAVPLWDRPRLFVFLADEPFAYEEWQALLAAAAPGRADEAGLAAGVVAAAGHARRTTDLVATLARAHAQQSLNAKDQSLLLMLDQAEPNALPDAFDDVLDSVLLYVSPDDLETIDQLAAAYERRGNNARAEALLRWLATVDSFLGCTPLRLEQRLERARRFVTRLDSSAAQHWRRHIAESLMPIPTESPRDEVLAAALEWAGTLKDAGLLDQLAVTADELVRSDPSKGYPGVLAALGRYYLSQANIERFAAIAKAYTDGDAHFFTYGAGRKLVDCRELLADDVAADTLEKALETITQVLRDQQARHVLTAAQAVRSLVLLAQWTHEHGFDVWTENFYRQAEQLNVPVGEPWLWLADAAELAGRHERSIELQTKLLSHAMLPMSRAAALLDEVERLSGVTAANQLAQTAAAYSNLPAVLHRAIAATRAQGDQAAVQQLTRRLKENWPNDN